MLLALVTIAPSSPVATEPLGQAVTLLSARVVGEEREVQLVPSGLARMVPPPPVTIARLEETVTPWRSLVVGTGRAYHSTPKALAGTLVTTRDPPRLVTTVTLVVTLGLIMRLP